MDCIAKTVTCWSHYAWVTMTLYYPQIEKGGIPPELHPAVIEDKWLAEPDLYLVGYNGRKGWKQGYTRSVIVNYLRHNGPQIISVIAQDIGGNSVQVTSILRRNPQMFRVVDYLIISHPTGGASKAAIWGLVEESN